MITTNLVNMETLGHRVILVVLNDSRLSKIYRSYCLCVQFDELCFLFLRLICERTSSRESCFSIFNDYNFLRITNLELNLEFVYKIDYFNVCALSILPDTEDFVVNHTILRYIMCLNSVNL